MKFSFGRFIDIKYFLISFAIGIFLVYITMQDANKIYVYPNPENVDFIQYKDRADQCFEFKETKVNCPTEKKDLFKIPVQ